MIPSFSPIQLNRYRKILNLFLKHGQRDFFEAARLEDMGPGDNADEKSDGKNDPGNLAEELEALGPTFIKLGQMLASRPDLLPPTYIDALSRLHDQIEPFPFDQVEEIVADELGVRISQAYGSFDEKPVAAASLGQVHRATLRDGRKVAVKVQRHGIRALLRNDLDVFEAIAGAIDRYTETGRRYAVSDVVDQFRTALYQELDYRQEARNLSVLADNLSDYESLIVPRPVEDLTSQRVLTMDFVEGTKVTELPDVTRTELDVRRLSVELCKAYLDQVLVDGFFHADPHPGNILLTRDGRLALIDLGMVAHVDPDRQRQLLKLVLAISDGRGRETAELGIELGEILDGADINRLKRQVAEVVNQRIHAVGERRKMGRVMMELARVSAENGVRTAPEITMLGKTLLNLDQIGQALDPEFDPDAVVRDHAHVVMRKYALGKLKPSSAFSGALEMHGLIEKLPRRINALLDAVAERELQIKIDAFDETRLMSNLEKIANRITLGLVLAALIIGAALMMRVETALTVFGYPAIAMVLFLLATALGLGLVIRMLVSDSKDYEKGGRR